MFKYNFLKNKTIAFIFSIFLGTIVGLLSVYLCIYFNLVIYGFNTYLIISPMIAGFVETYFSKNFTKETSGAVSSIILFIVTNAIGWLFPANPITWNIFTVGGFLIMLQAAFPLTINYILLALMLLFVFVFGRIGSILETIFIKRNQTTLITDMVDNDDELNILILTNEPKIPIKKYYGLIFSEEIIEFEDKNYREIIDYMASDASKRNNLKYDDYENAKVYVLNNLKKKAFDLGANAIIDIEIEYTNYNQQFPPDILLAIYGTAVLLDDKYIG